ncbi:MAG TPA: CotH kinase family protein, partial [Thermotogota bacterium]|nr:CotH kinase family protein [Thermotogota bacterium]
KKEPLKQLTSVLELPDDQLVDELSVVLDIDRYLTFLAVNYIANNSDAYNDAQNNFYVYFNPDDKNKATLIPWGVDKAFGNYNIPFSNHLQAEIPRLISRIPQLQEKMEQELLRVINEVWDEEEIINKIDNYSELVQSSGVSIVNFSQQVEALKAWVRQRDDQVRKTLSLDIGMGSESSTTSKQMINVKTKQAKEKYGEDKTFEKAYTNKEDWEWDKKVGETKEKTWDGKKALMESTVNQQSKEPLKDTSAVIVENSREIYYLGIIFLASVLMVFIKIIR